MGGVSRKQRAIASMVKKGEVVVGESIKLRRSGRYGVRVEVTPDNREQLGSCEPILCAVMSQTSVWVAYHRIFWLGRSYAFGERDFITRKMDSKEGWGD